MRRTNLLLLLMLLLTGCKSDITVIENIDFDDILIVKRNKLTGQIVEKPTVYQRKHKDTDHATD